MARRIGFWQHAVWFACAVALAHAAPARALVTVEGRQSATVQWAPSEGPVAGYYVFISRNDGGVILNYYSTVVGRASETIQVDYDKTFTVQVAAFDAAGGVGPLSDPSEAIVFVRGAPGGGTPPADDPPPDGDPPPAGAAAAPFDFDGSGTSDLLLHGGSQQDVEIWSMDGQGVADVTVLAGAGENAVVVGNGDYDGDGLADILWHDRGAGRVSVSFMDEGRSVGETVLLDESFPSGAAIVGSGDYNGDGISDVLIHTASENQFSVWTMDGSGSFEHSLLPDDFGDEAEVIASGDFDGDGMTDILWRHPPSGEVDIWGLTGDFSLKRLGGKKKKWIIIGAGDFDGDGRDDLLLRRRSADFLAVSLSTSGKQRKIRSKRNKGKSHRQVAGIGDYDGDGRTDLLVYNGSTYEACVWYMDGDSVAHALEIDSPGENWDFASVDERKPGSR